MESRGRADRARVSPSAPPARAALAEPSTQSVAGNSAGAIAHGLTVPVVAVDPRPRGVIAGHPGEWSNEPESDTGNVDSAGRARGLGHLTGTEGGSVAGLRHL